MSRSAIASILIVDDDQRNLMAMRELLQGLGQNLVLANSGEEALRCALKDDFAVILLDARMPGIDRFETAADGTGLSVTVPSNPNLAPPGYYMLFILNSTGVPSVAHMVRIGS